MILYAVLSAWVFIAVMWITSRETIPRPATTESYLFAYAVAGVVVSFTFQIIYIARIIV
jgi:hypothetical protein